MALQRRKSKNKRLEMPCKDVCNSYCNTSGNHVANIIGKIWGMCLQRQNQRGRDLLTVGYNIQPPLAGLVCKVSVFSFEECTPELISCHMIFQGGLLGRALGVHLCDTVWGHVGVGCKLTACKWAYLGQCGNHTKYFTLLPN